MLLHVREGARSGRVGLASGLILSLILLGGCAAGSGTNPRERDAGSGFDAGERPDSGGPGDCSPGCEPGFLCVEGRCMVDGVDVDGDNVRASEDCDDNDASVGRAAQRDCSGDCGVGIERCTDGVWEACTAPTVCECEDGDPPRDLDCGFCGTQQQICVSGRWENAGSCTSEGECAPGTMEMGGSCGDCGTRVRFCSTTCSFGDWLCTDEGVCTAGEVEADSEMCAGSCGGTRERTRTCRTDCTWGPFGAFGECSGGGGSCTPGETDTETGMCGNCSTGTRTRTRTCQADCTWGAFGAWSSCSGGGVCAPGDTRACASADPCGVEVCSATCTWGTTCQPDASVGNQCLYNSGSNYRCCTLTPTDDGWQFCLSSCRWSTACEATTAC